MDSQDACLYAEIRTRIPDTISWDYNFEHERNTPVTFTVKVAQCIPILFVRSTHQLFVLVHQNIWLTAEIAVCCPERSARWPWVARFQHSDSNATRSANSCIQRWRSWRLAGLLPLVCIIHLASNSNCAYNSVSFSTLGRLNSPTMQTPTFYLCSNVTVKCHTGKFLVSGCSDGVLFLLICRPYC